MKYCDKCKVDVKGNDLICPLCQNHLSGEADTPPFPVIPLFYKQIQLFIKFLILLTTAGGLICVIVNLMLPQTGSWCIFVLFGILCFWISLTSILKRKDNMFKTSTFQVTVLSLLCILLDLVNGWNGWSLNYFFPIMCAVAMLLMAVIANVKRRSAEDYIVYIVTVVLFGIFPIIFYFLGLVKVLLPSILCISISVLTLCYLLIFEGKNLVFEIKKRFHL